MHNKTYLRYTKMMSSKMIIAAFCITNMVINYAVNGDKIVFYQHMLNYVVAGATMIFATINSWKFGEVYIKGLEFELLITVAMISIERVLYYKNGEDLDFLHYGKIFVLYAYMYYKVEERDAALIVENIDQKITILSIKLKYYIRHYIN